MDFAYLLSPRFQFLFSLMCFHPFCRLWHLQALIPDPGCYDNQMRKDDAVAEQAKHGVERD